MQTEIKVPALGESITEVDIGEWLKKEGDNVAKDENLVSIESEKATVELPAPAAGVLAKILKLKGVANVGEVIAVIDSNGAPAAKKEPAKSEKVEPKPGPAAEPKAEPRVMPAAERLLAENKLRADQVTGTGPGGRILKEDVARHAETKVTPAAPPDHTAAPPPLPASQAKPATASAIGREDEVIPMTRLRRTVAARLVESQKTTA